MLDTKAVERLLSLSADPRYQRGYFVSTVGRDETVIREYIRNQEEEDKTAGPTQPLALTTSHR